MRLYWLRGLNRSGIGPYGRSRDKPISERPQTKVRVWPQNSPKRHDLCAARALCLECGFEPSRRIGTLDEIPCWEGCSPTCPMPLPSKSALGAVETVPGCCDSARICRCAPGTEFFYKFLGSAL